MERTMVLVLVTLLCVLAGPSKGADYVNKSSPETLKGVRKVHVLVEDLPSDAESDGLDKRQLKTTVELALQRTGLTIASLRESQELDLPLVYLNVNLSHNDTGRQYAFCVSLEVNETVRPVRLTIPAIRGATVWGGSVISGSAPEEMPSRVSEGVRMLSDSLCNDWLKANPRSGGR